MTEPVPVWTPTGIIDSLKSGERAVRVSSLAGSSPAYLAALITRELGRPVMVISPEESEAKKLADETAFYLGALSSKGLARLLPERGLYGALPGQDPALRRHALATMLASTKERPAAVSASIRAVLARTPSPESFHDRLFEITKGMGLDRDDFIAALVSSGYTAVSSAMEPGDFSVRGGIMDVFPPGADEPVRIELWGDEVESLRAFDPVDQKSRGEIGRALVPPFSEVMVTEDGAARAVEYAGELMARIKKGVPGAGEVDALKSYGEVLERMKRMDHFPGIADFLPAFHQGDHCALDYMDKNWVVIHHEPFLCDQAMARRMAELTDSFVQRLCRGDFAIPPEAHFTPGPRAERALADFATVAAGPASGAIDSPSALGFAEDLSRLRVDPEREAPLAPFIEALKDFADVGVRTVLVSGLPGKAERLRELLDDNDVHASVHLSPAGLIEQDGGLAIAVGNLSRGFYDRAGKLAVVPEAEVFGEKIRPKRRPRALESFISDLSDLGEGDYVVHVDHGVGLFRGLISIEVQWVGEWDFINLRERPRIRVDSAKIEYAKGANLFVPVHRINQISKYAGPTEEPPPLDSLGGTGWERLKKKARRSIREFAEELIKVHAGRKLRPGVSFPSPDRHFREFEESFEYEETPDQFQAIEDVLEDMAGEVPMDRVVCGDVGYGKTEVALRAAFLAAMSGRQVAVLVPTTILAQQHYETFIKRLDKYPLEVRSLSRFLSTKAQKEVVAGIKRGMVDIVIGTHRLLSKDVEWNDLGLLVIDEEHRFGVRHKERMKQLAAAVDTLTLTATPIPRTLYMSLSGLRDLSVIDTPPPDRLSVHTELVRADDRMIKEAIERELRRGGQAFFVHNRVKTIDTAAAKIKRLVPDARVAIGHGQMRERELERVMRDFVGGESDVLVCTAIIESGLDIPRANTMIIDRADHFGLAQLYQLRGRIGRAKLRGYCYMTVPAKGVLTRDAAKRLRALKEFTELGSGFRVAAHDLEIRGAGNILGAEQSGHLHRIGLELYMKLLEEEVARQKGETVAPEIEPEIKLPVPSYLPEEYVPSERERLGWYKRLGRARSDQEVASLREELIDRYGPLPDPAENLLEVSRIKGALKKLRAIELAYDGAELSLALSDDTTADVDRALALATKDPINYRLTPDGRLMKKVSVGSPAELFPAIGALLNEL